MLLVDFTYYRLDGIIHYVFTVLASILQFFNTRQTRFTKDDIFRVTSGLKRIAIY